MASTFQPRLDILPESQSALALHLEQRFSEGFDFFSTDSLDPGVLRNALPFLWPLDPSDAEIWIQRKPDNLEFCGGFSNLHRVVRAGVDLPSALAAARGIDAAFIAQSSIRALQFYGDGTLHRVPTDVQRDLTNWAQAVDLSRLMTLTPKGALTPERARP